MTPKQWGQEFESPPESPAPEDIQVPLAECNRRTPKGVHDHSLILMLIDAGLRASEIPGL